MSTHPRKLVGERSRLHNRVEKELDRADVRRALSDVFGSNGRVQLHRLASRRFSEDLLGRWRRTWSARSSCRGRPSSANTKSTAAGCYNTSHATMNARWHRPPNWAALRRVVRQLIRLAVGTPVHVDRAN